MIGIVSEDFGTAMLEKISQLEQRCGIRLSKYQKILLGEVGTVEQVLSIIANSPIRVELIRQASTAEGWYEREVWLKDDRNRRLVHAATRYNVNHLPTNLFEDLKTGRIGIGSAIVRHRLETFRKITEIAYDDQNQMLLRRYEIRKDGHILFEISESFSARLFASETNGGDRPGPVR
jgi:chorismate-pyruvate lyase